MPFEVSGAGAQAPLVERSLQLPLCLLGCSPEGH